MSSYQYDDGRTHLGHATSKPYQTEPRVALFGVLYVDESVAAMNGIFENEGR